MPVNCYSQRILNPFRGVMNIISTGGADAVTIDGLNWTLLYPKVINQKIINAACVEAMMRKSQSKPKDKTMETIEYIETQHSLI